MYTQRLKDQWTRKSNRYQGGWTSKSNLHVYHSDWFKIKERLVYKNNLFDCLTTLGHIATVMANYTYLAVL